MKFGWLFLAFALSVTEYDRQPSHKYDPNIMPAPTPTPQAEAQIVRSNQVTPPNNGQQLHFDCPIDQGYLNLSHDCSSCTIKTGLWVYLVFENGEVRPTEYLPGVVYRYNGRDYYLTDYLKDFVYDRSTSTLTYTRGSGNILYNNDDSENNLKCIPPTPLPTPFYRVPPIADESRYGNYVFLEFGCPILQGTINLIHNCSNPDGCRQEVEMDLWVNISFENNRMTNIAIRPGTMFFELFLKIIIWHQLNFARARFMGQMNYPFF